jgi:hypothetical protein
MALAGERHKLGAAAPARRWPGLTLPGVETSMPVQVKLQARESVRPLGNRHRPFGRTAW